MADKAKNLNGPFSSIEVIVAFIPLKSFYEFNFHSPSTNFLKTGSRKVLLHFFVDQMQQLTEDYGAENPNSKENHKDLYLLNKVMGNYLFTEEKKGYSKHRISNGNSENYINDNRASSASLTDLIQRIQETESVIQLNEESTEKFLHDVSGLNDLLKSDGNFVWLTYGTQQSKKLSHIHVFNVDKNEFHGQLTIRNKEDDKGGIEFKSATIDKATITQHVLAKYGTEIEGKEHRIQVVDDLKDLIDQAIAAWKDCF